jgi:hypothetical protein
LKENTQRIDTNQGGISMKRRDFFRTAMWGGALMIFGKGGALAKE